jgi:hypothetical protein
MICTVAPRGCHPAPGVQYYNPIDESGGYFRDYVFIPEAGDPLTQPIVRLCCSTIKLETTQYGQLRVNQDAIVFRSLAM